MMAKNAKRCFFLVQNGVEPTLSAEVAGGGELKYTDAVISQEAPRSLASDYRVVANGFAKKKQDGKYEFRVTDTASYMN